MPISIAISPEEAVEAGAQWRVIDSGGEGPWLASGGSADPAEPRGYRVEFRPVPGWREPAEMVVRNVVGCTNRKSAGYRRLATCQLGQVPPQTVWHGEGLEFLLAGAAGLAVSCEPQPRGELSWQPETGLFRYLPDLEDKFPFLVTVVSQGDGAKQTFEVAPMPLLPPEVAVFGDVPAPERPALRTMMVGASLIESESEIPAPEPEPLALPQPFSQAAQLKVSTYLPPAMEVEELRPQPITAAAFGGQLFTVSMSQQQLGAAAPAAGPGPTIETMENPEELFNHELRATTTIRIIGDEVVLEQGNAAYDQLHNNAAVKRLEIYAETVTVRAPLHLPQTEVSIYARELRFEDGADSVACIRTTPQDFSVSAAPATREPVKDDKGQVVKEATGLEKCTITLPGNGGNGEKGGDVFLHIESCTATNPSVKRFILTGGRGQDPGTGLAGRDGAKIADTESYGQASMKGTPWRIVYGEHTSKRSFFYKTHTSTWNAVKAWPTDGDPGTPAGCPGRGGDAGRLSSTLDLATWVEAAGGKEGERGPTYAGGKAGEPQYSVMIKSWDTNDGWDHKWGWDYLTHENKSSTITSPGAAAASPAGQAGSPAKPVVAGHPLSWLQPLLLHRVMEAARSGFLEGDYDRVRERLTGYAELLDLYQGLDVWLGLVVADRLELSRLRNEMAGLLSRLDCHLDYFGNPAGWVPLLSFEVNLTVFDHEIDRAIELLYLTYWLTRKAKDDQQRIATLTHLQTKLKQEIEELKGRFAKAAESVPELEAEAGRIAGDINLLQEKLRNLEEELRQKAEEQLEEPWWKTGLKIAGTLCSVMPFWQPALGAVGGVMKLTADFDPDHPWETITGAADVAQTFAKARVSDKKKEFEQVSKKVDTKSKEFKALKSAEWLEEATTGLTKGLDEVSKAVSARQAPKSEVDALLQKLESESKEFKELSGEIASLFDRKMTFAQQLTDALQQLGEIPKAITAHLLAIDAAASAVARGRGVLHDGRLTMHLEAMERRAKERLLKYHYYLARSYEYRLLRRYPGKLDLDQVFKEMEHAAELNLQGDQPYALTREQFTSLKGVYRETLASIAEEILDAYTEDPPELSAPRRFSLSQAEISRLNQGKPVTINPMAMGLFRLVEENVRIVDLAVERLEVSLEGAGERRLAELDLRFEHTGVFQLRQAGRSLQFRHPVRGTATAIAWGARYDAFDQSIDPIRPSAASDSLLRSLLKSDTAADMMLYAQPSAWGDITVRCEPNTEPGTAISVKDVRLNLRYSFGRQSPAVQTVHVSAAPESANLQPYFIVDQTDLNGRGDGRGDFYRAYQGLPTLTLAAQPRYGKWKFARWTDAAGKTLANSPSLAVKVDDDRELRAVYALAE